MCSPRCLDTTNRRLRTGESVGICLLILVALQGAPLKSADAQHRWTRIAPTASDTYFLDASTLSFQSPFARATVSWSLGAGMLAFEDLQVHCETLRVRSRRLATHDVDPQAPSARGQRPSDKPGQPSDWMDYPSGSDGALVARDLCAVARRAP